MKRSLLFAVLVIGLACNRKSTGQPRVEISTSFGDIEIELYRDKAPKTVTAFLSYVDQGLYTNASFYRVLTDDNQPSNAPKAELIQGGIWKTNYRKSASLPGTPHESTRLTQIKHLNGVISLARREPGTGSSEFFICIGDQPGFDYGGENNPDGQGYAAFGKVVRGMEVVSRIYQQPENNQSLTPLIPIYSINRK